MKAKLRLPIGTDLFKIPAVDLFKNYIYPKSMKFLKVLNTTDPTVHYYLCYNNKFGTEPFYIRVRGTKKLVIETSNNGHGYTEIRKIGRSKLANFIHLNVFSIFELIFDSINLMECSQDFTKPFPELCDVFSILNLSLLKKNLKEDFNLGSLEFDISRQYNNYDSHFYLTVGLAQGYIYIVIANGEIKFNIDTIRMDSNPYIRVILIMKNLFVKK
jgi:hypothetical protein